MVEPLFGLLTTKLFKGVLYTPSRLPILTIIFYLQYFSLILIIGSQDHVLQSFSLKLMLSNSGSTSDEIFWSSPSLGEDPRENDGGLFAVYIILFVPCIQKKIQNQDVEV